MYSRTDNPEPVGVDQGRKPENIVPNTPQTKNKVALQVHPCLHPYIPNISLSVSRSLAVLGFNPSSLSDSTSVSLENLAVPNGGGEGVLEVVVLVGPPAAGKSTLCKAHLSGHVRWECHFLLLHSNYPIPCVALFSGGSHCYFFFV